jgi:hypothetical protein
MKLAEALALRADTQKRIEQMRERLRQSALVQEGEQPPEDPRALLAEVERLIAELAALIARINRTNLATRLADGTTLTDALARRDTLILHYSLMSSAAEAAAKRLERYSRSEIRLVAVVPVSELRGKMDDLARQRRELDLLIQAANWATDLAE